MRPSARTLFAALLFSVMPAIAAPPPHANGHANGQENGNGGNSGNAGQPGSPNPPAASPAGQSLGNVQEGDDAASRNQDAAPKAKPKAPTDEPATSASPVSGKAKPTGPKDQNEAQKAVEERRALPLAKIIKIAERRDKGTVINARLVRVSGVLLYQLTLLNDAGRSWRVYYHAQRGNPVVLP